MRTRQVADHGTVTRYWQGCKCQECKDAHNAYRRELYRQSEGEKRRYQLDYTRRVKAERRELPDRSTDASISHGTTAGYDWFLCRCRHCTRAKVAANAESLAKDRQIDPTRCGTRTQYQYYKCRCGFCREANSAYQKEWKRRRKA
jgi:hypothetical protein